MKNKIITDNKKLPNITTRGLHDILDIEESYNNWFDKIIKKLCKASKKNFKDMLIEKSGKYFYYNCIVTLETAILICRDTKSKKGKQIAEKYTEIKNDIGFFFQ